MDYLIQENKALRKELIELLEITIKINNFLTMVKNNLKDEEKEYIKFILESSNLKIEKLKYLLDG